MTKFLRLSKISLIAFLLGGVITFTSCGDDEDPIPTLEVNNFTASVDENPTQGQVIGSLDVTASAGVLEYATSSTQFSINADGAVVVSDVAAFDFETNTSITGTVTVTITGTAVEENIDVTITINDVFEPSDAFLSFSDPDNSETIAIEPDHIMVLGSMYGTTDGSGNVVSGWANVDPPNASGDNRTMTLVDPVNRIWALEDVTFFGQDPVETTFGGDPKPERFRFLMIKNDDFLEGGSDFADRFQQEEAADGDPSNGDVDDGVVTLDCEGIITRTATGFGAAKIDNIVCAEFNQAGTFTIYLNMTTGRYTIPGLTN